MKNNYFVSVFVNGKNANLYFAETLDDLATVRAFYKDCEICVFDMRSFEQYPDKHVESEITQSEQRCKDVIELPADLAASVRTRPKKYWERPVLCVETGKVYSSIRECCDHLGLSHKSLWNAINSGTPRNGLHFENASESWKRLIIK